jgi:hypothetical protein
MMPVGLYEFFPIQRKCQLITRFTCADTGMRSQHTTMKQSKAKGTKENEAEYIIE